MEKANFGQIVSFLFGIANDCLVDTYDVGDYRKIILPMMVIRRFDAVLEPTKEKVLKMKEQLDAAGITDQDEALCSVAGEAFCNSSPYTLSDLKSRTNQQQLKSDFILYLNGFSQNVQDIIKRFEFRNQIDKLSEHDILGLLISKFTDSSVNLSNRPICDAKGNVIQPALDNHTSFTDFCPYTVDLDYYKELRAEFDIHEWIDILLGAIDYNASGYADEDQKRAVLTRLLPFVEKRLNLIELAPPGTGKSYIFGSISKYGNLSAGYMTRAKLFYDLSKRQPGLVYNNDYVAFDEVHKLRFQDEKQMGGSLQTYMENGKVSIPGHDGTADAGMILLGNIEKKDMDETMPMFDKLPALFHDSAMVDRFHGFIKGWDIPPMTNAMKISGWGLNSEYFCTIMHLLRDDPSYRVIVDKLVEVPGDAYIRHVEAVKRITTAYLKLFFPHVRSAQDVNVREFTKYCLRPAIEMRKNIWRQLAIMDPAQYRKEDREMPAFTVRDLSNEN